MKNKNQIKKELGLKSLIKILEQDTHVRDLRLWGEYKISVPDGTQFPFDILKIRYHKGKYYVYKGIDLTYITMKYVRRYVCFKPRHDWLSELEGENWRKFVAEKMETTTENIKLITL